MHERQDNVCDPIFHGTFGITTCQTGHPGDGFRVCGSIHENNDPHGQSSTRFTAKQPGLREGIACCWRSKRWKDCI